MISRHTSRLVVGSAALGFIVALLFIGSKTSAAPADRTPPTAPKNLVVTARTETTIAVAWNSSTDNSGKFSYKVRIDNLNNSAYNSLTTVSQTQTGFTAKFLSPNNTHTFSVYAVDAAGNRSADSNKVTVSTLADTTPPSTPALEATVVGPSQVRLSWTSSKDNVSNNCCSYGINMNGSRTTEHINWAGGPPENQTAVLRHLTPATTFTFSISASDWTAGRNTSTSNTMTVTTEPSSDTVPPTAPTNLHLIRDDGCGEVWLGWDQATDGVDAQEHIEYEIYVNGKLSPLPVSAGVNMDFVYATAQGDNVFYVKAVDRSGNTSAASVSIKVYLWPC